MQISISGHHIELTKPLKDYVARKLSKLEGHCDHINHADIILSIENMKHKAEATLNISGGTGFFASSEHGDMYTSVDLLVKKLDRQLSKHKGKKLNRSSYG